MRDTTLTKSPVVAAPWTWAAEMVPQSKAAAWAGDAGTLQKFAPGARYLPAHPSLPSTPPWIKATSSSSLPTHPHTTSPETSPLPTLTTTPLPQSPTPIFSSPTHTTSADTTHTNPTSIPILPACQPSTDSPTENEDIV